MDPNSRFNDRDNTYNSSFSQPTSSLSNKSPNQMKYSSTGHNDHHTTDYTHAPHYDNIYSSQRVHDIRTTHDFHPSQQASGSFSLDHLGVSHKPAQSTDLAASGHYQVYGPSYQFPSHHHDTHVSNVPKSSHDDVQASLDSARLARNAALELLNQGTGRNLKESHTHLEPLRTSHHGVYSPAERAHEGFGLGAITSTYANLSTGHGVVTRSPIEETKVGFDHHVSNQDRHTTHGQTVTDYENLSPEARRILGSSVSDEIKSTSHMSPERKPLIHHDSSPNPYLSTLANTAQTTIRDTHTQALVRHSDVNPSSLHRELFENINDYRLNDPVVSKRTIYTIENNTASVIRSPAHDIRSYHTPERVQKARSPLRSPLDELRHSLNTNSAKISKIVIETVEDGTGVEGPYVDVESLGNNRVDIIMEETVPHGSSHHSLSPYKSPATERLTRRRNEQEAAFREPSDAVRYQTRSDHFDTDHHHYSHDEHHTHHNEEHHHAHHEVAPSPAKNVQHREEEETKHDPKIEKVVKEEVHIHKEKKPSHLIVKGVIGLLVIILSSLLWLELFTDIKFDKYYTF